MKHAIAAIILAVSASAHAQPAGRAEICAMNAETVDAMLQLINEGVPPTRILTSFKKHIRDPFLSIDDFFRVATMYARIGTKSGPRFVSMLYNVCMEVE